MQKLLTFFSKNIIVYAIFNDQILNIMLTNDTVSFEQLGPALNSERNSSKQTTNYMLLNHNKLVLK